MSLSTDAQPGTASSPVHTLLTPDWVSRTNLYPFLDLVETDQASTDQERLGDLVAEEDFRQEVREPAADELSELIAQDRERASRVWLPLRRAVLAGRHPKAGHLTETVPAGHPTLEAWLASWRRTHELTEALDSDFTGAATQEQHRITDWARDPDVQLSTVMTSRSLYSAVASRASAEGSLTKRQRKSEQSLVTYFGRSTTKVSPFSRYTGVALHGPDETAGPLRTGHVSVVALRRLLVRKAARRLATDPVDRLDLPWSVSDSCGEVDGAIVVHRRTWIDTSTAKADSVHEEDVRLPLRGSWRQVWDALVAARHGTLRTLIGTVAGQLAWPAEHAAAALDTLIRYGVLVPAPPVREQDDDYLDQWLEVLRPLHGQTARALRAAVEVSLAGEQEMPGADPQQRVRIIEQTQHAWQDLVPTGADNPYVEDCYLQAGAPVDGADIASWAEQTGQLGTLLVAMDDQRILAAALESVFVGEFGLGGVCRDLRAFARKAYDTFPLTQQLLDGHVPDHLRPVLVPLNEARALITNHLLELSRTGDADHTAYLDPDVLDRAGTLVPDREWDLPRSLTVFGQPAGRELVVNHLYGGRAHYFSRFLAQHGSRATDRIRAAVTQAGPDGARGVHMRPALGFNANLGPLLTQEELRLTDEHPGEQATSSIDDLALVHDPRTGLRLICARDGRTVDLLYTGFLVPHALPAEEMLLALAAGVPYYSFNQLTLDLHTRLLDSAGPFVRTPRIQYRDLILFRARWGVQRSYLTGEGTSVDGPEGYRRLGQDRLRAGLPSQVFARPLLGRGMTPVEQATSPRPQFLDLGSRLHQASLPRRTGDLGETLLLEEFWPRPDIHGARSPRGRHATELFYEIALAPGGHR